MSSTGPSASAGEPCRPGSAAIALIIEVSASQASITTFWSSKILLVSSSASKVVLAIGSAQLAGQLDDQRPQCGDIAAVAIDDHDLAEPRAQD